MSRVSTSSKDAELQGVTDQANAQGGVQHAFDGKLPGRAKKGSMSYQRTAARLSIIAHDSKGKPGQPFSIPAAVQTYTGDFTSIGGTITAAQHGALAGGTLHAEVIAAGAAGFMSGADKTKLDNYPPAATTTANDSNAVQRNSGVINGTQYNVSGARVVTARQAGWTVATGGVRNALTAASSQADHNEALRALIIDLHSAAGHGLIGP